MIPWYWCIPVCVTAVALFRAFAQQDTLGDSFGQAAALVLWGGMALVTWLVFFICLWLWGL